MSNRPIHFEQSIASMTCESCGLPIATGHWEQCRLISTSVDLRNRYTSNELTRFDLPVMVDIIDIHGQSREAE